MFRPWQRLFTRRHRRSSRAGRPRPAALRCEPLGDRIVPAVTFSGGVLSIIGNPLANTYTISRTTGGAIRLNGQNLVVNGALVTVGGTARIAVNSGGGDDTVTLDTTNGPLPKAV